MDFIRHHEKDSNLARESIDGNINSEIVGKSFAADVAAFAAVKGLQP